MSAERKSHTAWPDRQRGITLIGGLLWLIIAAFVALIVLRVVPIYIDYFTIITTLQGLKKEPQVGQMSADDIYRTIERRFDISYVQVIKPQQIKIRKQGNNRVLDLIYEDRRPLIGNLDIVAKFNDTIVLSP